MKIRMDQPGSAPIDVPEQIPKPRRVDEPTPTPPREPAEPVRKPQKVPA